MDLSYLPNGGTGHQVPNDDTLKMWSDIHSKILFKNMLEIGFNAGHSSCIVLTLLNDVTIDSTDIGLHDITIPNSKIVKEKFGDRFNFTLIDSKKLTPVVGKYDFVFIDGDHSYPGVSADFDFAKKSKIPYALLDDLQNPGVGRFVREDYKKFETVGDYTYISNTGRLVKARLVKVLW